MTSARKDRPPSRDMDGMVPCAVVAAGTSRFVVAPGSTNFVRACRTVVELIHDNDAVGLGGDSYQLNKAVVVLPATDNAAPHEFVFLQVDPVHGGIHAVPECLNAGVAAALYALSTGAAAVDSAGDIYVRNRRTAQTLRLTPPHGRGMFTGPWLIRYRPLASFDPIEVPVPRCLAAAWIVHAGNVIVLAAAATSTADVPALRRLEEVGTDQARKAGIDEEQARELKIIIYKARVTSAAGITVRVRQYYHGQLHRSIAGSGALVLARHLAGRLRARSSTPPALVTVTVRHPSGTARVRVGYRPDGGDEVDWAEVETPARLLLTGLAPAASGSDTR